MITGLYAGILGFIYLILSFLVIRQRLKNKIGVGYNKNEDVLRAVRVHANFAEYVPMALIMMAIAESMLAYGFTPYYLHAIGLTLVIARVAHAYGLSRSIATSPGRFMGAILTFLVLLVLSATLIIQYAIA